MDLQPYLEFTTLPAGHAHGEGLACNAALKPEVLKLMRDERVEFLYEESILTYNPSHDRGEKR